MKHGQPGIFTAQPQRGSAHTLYSKSAKAKRLEFRCPDPACNPYLAFSAIMMAAVDGIQNKIDPGKPLDKNIYDLPPEEAKKVAKTPGSLRESLNALKKDHAFLLKGDVFTRMSSIHGLTTRW